MCDIYLNLYNPSEAISILQGVEIDKLDKAQIRRFYKKKGLVLLALQNTEEATECLQHALSGSHGEDLSSLDSGHHE